MPHVNSDLFARCSWSYSHEIVTKGCASIIKIDIDDPVLIGAERVDENTWRVTIHSAAHGLVDGSIVSVSGMPAAMVRGIELTSMPSLSR